MRREDVLEYIQRNYTSDRMVVAAAGDVDHKQLVAEVEKHFKSVPTPKHSKITLPKGKPFFCGSELIQRNDDMGPIAHVAVGFEGVPWNSPGMRASGILRTSGAYVWDKVEKASVSVVVCSDVVAFMLMQALIGSYRKHEEGLVPGVLSANNAIREIASKMKTGCAEMFSAFNTCYTDTGIFGFYAQCDEVAVDHCVLGLMHAITSLSYSVRSQAL